MMKPTVLITGANSFIAKHLIKEIEQDFEIKLLTRNPKNSNEYHWDLVNRTIDESALDDVDYIIHLAGSKLNDGTPLTPERQALVHDSRIGAALFLREKLESRKQSIKSFISASAIGYYGFSDNSLEIDENGAMGTGFAATLSRDWESAADTFKINGVAEHVAKIRVSIVLGNEGGIFPIYLSMFKERPGIASAKNPSALPWNHVKDMAGIFAFVLRNQLDGVYNSVAPEPASLQNVFEAINNEVDQTNEPLTPFEGQHLVSHQIIAAGYQFSYPNITKAIKNLLKS